MVTKHDRLLESTAALWLLLSLGHNRGVTAGISYGGDSQLLTSGVSGCILSVSAESCRPWQSWSRAAVPKQSQSGVTGLFKHQNLEWESE